MSVNPPDILAVLRKGPARVTVVGDVMLDRWLHGRVQRISREAPVPVVEEIGVNECAGGAGNTAVNLAALGAAVRLIGVVGDDVEGRALCRLLDEAGVDTSRLQVAPGVTTLSKTRIVGEDQVLVRVDRAARQLLPDPVRAAFTESLAAIDGALVVCDYDAGLLDSTSIDRLAALPRPELLVVDAHAPRRWAPLRPDVVTPNSAETATLLGAALAGSGRAEAVAASAQAILAAAGARGAVVTLDRDGTVVLQDGRVTARTRTRPAPESQTSGAGDTFAAALTLALSVGSDLPAAAAFAQRAADVVVNRPGTAVCSILDLDTAANRDARGATVEEVREALAAERERGKVIVFTNGCFDVIHLGHTTHLRQAKSLGDVLVVALNDDDSVRRLKGSGRPVNPMRERAAVIEALGCVDHVIVFREDAPLELLRTLKPDIYAKGGDYLPEMLEEAAVVAEYGGEVRILDYLPGHSTTTTVNRILSGPGAH